MAQQNQVNWLGFLVRALSTVPYIVAGIEHIHGDAVSGADKKQLAMEALGLSTAIAPAIDPAHADTIAAASQLASSTIDGVVSVMNSASKKPPAAAPVLVVSEAPVPATAPAGQGASAPSSVWP